VQRFNEYAQTMLTAFREVEDSLAQEKYQLLRIKRINEQVKLAGQASDQLREQYLIGDAEYLDVLSASTTQQSLQRQLLSAQLELVLIRVSLYLALAGDFQPFPPDLQESTAEQDLGDELLFDTQESSRVELQDYLKAYLKESTDAQAVPDEAGDPDSLEIETERTASQRES
jgi:hypothetical protein